MTEECFLRISFSACNDNIRYRMKRSSSSTKENGLKNTHKKSATRKWYLDNNLTSLASTQTFFPSRQQSSMNSPQVATSPFYNTLGPNNFPEWGRPESKQAYRKYYCRPETSKGVRTAEKPSNKWTQQTKTGAYRSQYIPERTGEESREEWGSNIEIIVTKSRKKENNIGKEEKSKFETDLDD